jgi:hypothetical protein
VRLLTCHAIYKKMTRSLLVASRVRDRDPLCLESLSHTPVEFTLNCGGSGFLDSGIS